jgi:hypothetical protein
VLKLKNLVPAVAFFPPPAGRGVGTQNRGLPPPLLLGAALMAVAALLVLVLASADLGRMMRPTLYLQAPGSQGC